MYHVFRCNFVVDDYEYIYYYYKQIRYLNMKSFTQRSSLKLFQLTPLYSKYLQCKLLDIEKNNDFNS